MAVLQEGLYFYLSDQMLLEFGRPNLFLFHLLEDHHKPSGLFLGDDHVSEGALAHFVEHFKVVESKLLVGEGDFLFVYFVGLIKEEAQFGLGSVTILPVISVYVFLYWVDAVGGKVYGLRDVFALGSLHWRLTKTTYFHKGQTLPTDVFADLSRHLQLVGSLRLVSVVCRSLPTDLLGLPARRSKWGLFGSRKPHLSPWLGISGQSVLGIVLVGKHSII